MYIYLYILVPYRPFFFFLGGHNNPLSGYGSRQMPPIISLEMLLVVINAKLKHLFMLVVCGRECV